MGVIDERVVVVTGPTGMPTEEAAEVVARVEAALESMVAALDLPDGVAVGLR